MIKLALGTAQFGMPYGINNKGELPSRSDVIRTLNCANDNGVKILDTAQVYGNSESLIGELNMHRFRVVTKIGPTGTDSLSATQLVTESLARLKLEKIYAVLAHSAEFTLANPKLIEDLRRLKDQGLIEKIGYSVYTPGFLSDLIEKYGLPDIVQFPYSHLDRRFESLGNELHKFGVEIHTRSAFLQGLMFRDVNLLPSFFSPVKDYLISIRDTLGGNKEIANYLFNYCSSKDFVDYVVVGVNNEFELLDIINGPRDSFSLKIEIPDFLSEDILLPYRWPKN